jgi:hypothetical protein
MRVQVYKLPKTLAALNDATFKIYIKTVFMFKPFRLVPNETIP